MIQGLSSAGSAQDMGRRRARVGGTLKDLVSSFLASNPPAILVCAGSPSEGLSGQLWSFLSLCPVF